MAMNPDTVVSFCEDLIADRQWPYLDAYVRHVAESAHLLDVASLLAVLAATLRVRDKLVARPVLVYVVTACVRQRAPERAERLLRGLS